jgi:hypothetical protein
MHLHTTFTFIYHPWCIWRVCALIFSFTLLFYSKGWVCMSSSSIKIFFSGFKVASEFVHVLMHTHGEVYIPRRHAPRIKVPLVDQRMHGARVHSHGSDWLIKVCCWCLAFGTNKLVLVHGMDPCTCSIQRTTSSMQPHSYVIKRRLSAS